MKTEILDHAEPFRGDWIEPADPWLRLASAIILQATKDYCSKKIGSSLDALAWFLQPGAADFMLVSGMEKVDPLWIIGHGREVRANLIRSNRRRRLRYE